MRTIEISQNQAHEKLSNLCAIIFRKQQKIRLAADSHQARKIVDQLRKIPNIIDGTVINQQEYCYYLLRALHDNYINTLDEFANLHLKICLACDFKTKVTTKSILLDEAKLLIQNQHFLATLRQESLTGNALTYATLIINEQAYKQNSLVTTGFAIRTNKNEIATYGSNIPLSDIKKLPDGYYEIRLSTFELIKVYYKAFFWYPNFNYCFGLSTKQDILNGLQYANKLGRDINLWCPDPNIKNFLILHNIKAHTSVTTLHDIIHLSILTSYPKELPPLVYKIVTQMRMNHHNSTIWADESLSWQLIDFAVSHESSLINTNQQTQLASLLLSLLRITMRKSSKIPSPIYKHLIAPIFFCELLLLIKQDKLTELLELNELLAHLELDYNDNISSYDDTPLNFYFQLLVHLFTASKDIISSLETTSDNECQLRPKN